MLPVMRATSPASRSRPGSCRLRSPGSWSCSRLFSGSSSAPRRARGRSRWPLSSSRSATATTWASRGRPGHGSRSRSASRCCPCSAGLARPAACRRRSRCSLPVAVVAGTGLAIANARADLERDTAAGVDSVAVRLGSERAWTVEAALMTAVVGAAIVTLAAVRAPVGALAIAIGAGVHRRARRRDRPSRRQRPDRARVAAPGHRRRAAGGGLAGRDRPVNRPGLQPGR